MTSWLAEDGNPPQVAEPALHRNEVKARLCGAQRSGVELTSHLHRHLVDDERGPEEGRFFQNRPHAGMNFDMMGE
jgi:hypothetical protein